MSLSSHAYLKGSVCYRIASTQHIKRGCRLPIRSERSVHQPGTDCRDESAQRVKRSGCSDQQSAKQWSNFIGGPLAAIITALGGDGGSGGGRGWNGGNEGGGGGGRDGDGSSNQLYEIAAKASEQDEEEEEDDSEEEGALEGEEDEEDDEYEDDDDGWNPGDQKIDDLGRDEFRVDEIVAEGLPVGEGVPTKEELFAQLQSQPGFVCSKSDVSTDLRNFMNWGVFQDVQARVTPGKDGKSRLVFTFIDQIQPPPKSLEVLPYKGSGKLVLPSSEISKARQQLLAEEGPLDAKKLFQLRHTIEDWYQKRGYSNCYVTTIDGMDTGKLRMRVLEGRVNNVKVVQVDADGAPTGRAGNVPLHTILREVPIQKGELFHADMLRKCLREVFGLGLFESMSVNTKANPRDDTKVDIELLVKERPLKTADIDLEWQLARTANGGFGLASWVPGGSMTWENGNLFGTGRQLSATATTADFLNPSDDLGYQLSFKQPDLRGQYDPMRSEFDATVFNTRKLSSIFAGGPDIPSIFVDRTGAKLIVSERYSRNSKGQYGLVLEHVVSVDEAGHPVKQGTKPLFTGEYDPSGPETSLSGTGQDRIAFLQSAFTRDTTYFLHGQQLGSRQLFQVDQGLGLGSGRPIFNRHRVSLTQFLPLGGGGKDGKSPPRTLVLHGRYGGCVGDQPPYDLFTLGGPFSVRGYSVGEVAASRFFVEGAVEVRLPVKGHTAYAFAEGASDLGSSANDPFSPTVYYQKPGSAASLGAGFKLGAARLEVASEGLRKPTILNIRFGDRF